MDVSLYQSAAAMNATERWQDMIAENLTSASVPGMRKQDITFSSVEASQAAGAGGASCAIPSATATLNFEPGELRPGGPMDFAIEGKGFFTVQLPNGQRGYTRDGEFHINSAGQLATKSGALVMGDGGPLQFDPNNSKPINVSATGEVSQANLSGGTDQKGKLQITEFKKPQLLTMTTGGNFIATDPAAQPSAASGSKVRQGYVEAANTSPTLEMSGLITAMRMFETNQKVMQMQSDRMSRVISDLGGTS
jgi:flagellar basal body rod protein FlgG